MRKNIALISLIFTLALVNASIVSKEKHLAEGTVVYLELVPVDPRSLMQGDYMALRFRLADEIYNALPKSKGTARWRRDINTGDGDVIVSLDEKNIAAFRQIHTGQTLRKNEILMHYRVRAGVVKFASNAFFFQEGHEKYYEAARFGQFRVDGAGELLLEAMYDENLNKLEPAPGRGTQ